MVVTCIKVFLNDLCIFLQYQDQLAKQQEQLADLRNNLDAKFSGQFKKPNNVSNMFITSR
jgi:hypothetical protein